ncbi:unnamed protein product [Prunus brigantina]
MERVGSVSEMGWLNWLLGLLRLMCSATKLSVTAGMVPRERKEVTSLSVWPTFLQFLSLRGYLLKFRIQKARNGYFSFASCPTIVAECMFWRGLLRAYSPCNCRQAT